MIRWLETVRQASFHFLESMQLNEWSYSKFSLKGDLLGPGTEWGLANLVFMTKSLYTSGHLENLTERQLDNIYRGIMRFERDGYFTDPYISGVKFEAILKFWGMKNALEYRKNVIAAETKQVLVALWMLNRPYSKKVSCTPKATPNSFISEIEKMDWRRPWHTASQSGIRLFFAHHNAKFSGENFKDLLEPYLAFLKSIQNSDGSWGDTLDRSERINGAMKVLMSLNTVGVSRVPKQKELLDLTLSSVHDKEACYNFNITQVIASSFLALDGNYKTEQVKAYLKNRVEVYKEFYHESDGGFSFNRGEANKHYYGKAVSRGLNVPDIQGTSMFLLGGAIVDQVLKLNLGYRYIPQ